MPVAVAQDPGGEIEVRQQEAAPQPGATPAQIVDGFVRAGADRTSEGRTIADKYLAQINAWDESGDTFVFSSYTQEAADAGTDPRVRRVAVTYRMLARITPDGEYRPDVRSVVEVYRLEDTDGNWRIGSLPRGLRIRNDDLRRAFRRVVPYFYANTFEPTLVPDPVYLPGGDALVTSVIQKLLNGPTPWLSDYVAVSAFPRGTKLLSAPLTGEIAELTFSRELNDAPEADRKHIIAQLVWTLTSLTQAQITAVDIRVEGEPFLVGAEMQADARTRNRWSAYAPEGDGAKRSTYFNLRGILARYRPATLLAPGMALGSANAQLAVDSADAQVAVVDSSDGGRLGLTVAPMTGGQLSPPLIQSRFLTAPSWGPRDEGVWVVKQDEKGGPEVFLVPVPKDARPIPAPQLTARVHAFEVAPDGVRVAVIYQVGGTRRAFVGLIKRDPTGQALSVGGLPQRSIAPDVDVAAVTWAGSGQLAVLGRRGAAKPAVFTAAVDGSELQESKGSSDLLESSTSAQLVGRSDGELVLVVDGTSVFRNDGTDWRRLTTIREAN